MDARKDEALPPWGPPVLLVLFSAAVTAMGLRVWTLVSSLIATAVVMLSLQLPRRMLLAATTSVPRDTDEMLEDNLALRQLQLRRLIATCLLIGSPFFQYFAITHINRLDEDAARADPYLNPGLIAICSSLYVLNTLSHDHVQECMQLQAWYQSDRAKREGADSLLQRISALETTLVDVQRKLEGYKNALQSSIHAISRVKTGGGEVELQVQQLRDELDELHHRFFQKHGQSAGRQALGIIFAIEWPWTKLNRFASLLGNITKGSSNHLKALGDGRRSASSPAYSSAPSSRSSTPWKGEPEYSNMPSESVGK